jgi:phosphoribosylglycinamide formyltransferase 1
MKKIIFLGSGGGGNLKFIHQYSLIYPNLFSVVMVITDRECGASDYADEMKIPHKIHSFKRTKEQDNLLIQIIDNCNPDLIVTNVHKILSINIVNTFSDKLINLHYSYLPAFGGLIGMAPVDKSLERNNLLIGCTLHFVDEVVDTGETIAQGVVIKKESLNIYQSVFECGVITLLSGILKLFNQDDVNFIVINHYLITPYSTVIDNNLCNKIISNLKKTNDSIQ